MLRLLMAGEQRDHCVYTICRKSGKFYCQNIFIADFIHKNENDKFLIIYMHIIKCSSAISSKTFVDDAREEICCVKISME